MTEDFQSDFSAPPAKNIEESKKIYSPIDLSKSVPKLESKKPITEYESPWKIYALGFSWRLDLPLRFGIGSFLEGQPNKVFF